MPRTRQNHRTAITAAALVAAAGAAVLLAVAPAGADTMASPRPSAAAVAPDAVVATDCVAVAGTDLVQVIVSNTGTLGRTFELVNGAARIAGAELAPGRTAHHEVATSAGPWILVVDGQDDAVARTDPEACGAVISSVEEDLTP